MGWLSRLFGSGKAQAKVEALDPIDLSTFAVDYHSHLVPGVDDGAQSLEESLEMIDALVSLGYR